MGPQAHAHRFDSCPAPLTRRPVETSPNVDTENWVPLTRAIWDTLTIEQQWELKIMALEMIEEVHGDSNFTLQVCLHYLYKQSSDEFRLAVLRLLTLNHGYVSLANLN